MADSLILSPGYRLHIFKATAGLEPAIEVLQTPALSILATSP